MGCVYEHKQGSWRAYRVAISIDGKLVQEYFPFTREGHAAAKRRAKELEAEQLDAQKNFTGPHQGRWAKTGGKR